MGITWQRRGRLEDLEDGAIVDNDHTVAYALAEQNQASYVDKVDYGEILKKVDDHLEEVKDRLKEHGY